MWEKISKEMQLPWRAAEAMHWQIGEVEMAQRANVSVFHLAGQQSSQVGASLERAESISPLSATGSASTLPFPQGYPSVHNHSLPQISLAQAHPLSPAETRLRSNSNSSVSPPNMPQQLRRRADSVQTMSTASNRMQLPPMGELGRSSPPLRYTLPPVVTSPDTGRR